MTFKQVLSLWIKSGMSIWNEMETVEKFIFGGLVASSLLLIISFWRVL